MSRHHRGALPKSYYAPNGELYSDALFHGKRNNNQYKRDVKKTKEGEERAKVKLAQQIREAQRQRDSVPTAERVKKAREASRIIKERMNRK